MDIVGKDMVNNSRSWIQAFHHPGEIKCLVVLAQNVLRACGQPVATALILSRRGHDHHHHGQDHRRQVGHHPNSDLHTAGR